jgi:hypothetical protein
MMSLGVEFSIYQRINDTPPADVKPNVSRPAQVIGHLGRTRFGKP